jgi:hypothetical protein
MPMHRPGDLARIEENVSGSGSSRKSSKSKTSSDTNVSGFGTHGEGVVFKVHFSYLMSAAFNLLFAIGF